MTVEERKKFWETLLKAKNEQDIEMVNSKIIYPKKIYRYRSVNIRNLNALAENKLYFSTPNNYDDPFDTYIKIDEKYLTDVTNTYFKHILKDEDLKNMKNNALKNIIDARKKIRERLWTICFSERYDNESLWLKYAGNHKGFVLEYDVESLQQGIIFFEADIFSDAMRLENNFLPIYPIYYSDEIIDGTNYANAYSLMDTLEKFGYSEFFRKISDYESYKLEKMRVILIKKIIHHYDEEWRLILNKEFPIEPDSHPCILFNPTKIILGLKISDDDKKAVLMAAEKAEIKSIEQMTIDDNDNFVAKPIKF